MLHVALYEFEGKYNIFLNGNNILNNFNLFHFLKQENQKDEKGTVWNDLTHNSPVLLIYTPWKHQKTFIFLMFWGDIDN